MLSSFVFMVQFVLHERVSHFFTMWFCIIKSLLLVTLDIFTPMSGVIKHLGALKMYFSPHKIHIFLQHSVIRLC
jgi:hypothetical protein